MNGKDLAIILLTISAAFLGLIVMVVNTEPAYASTTSAAGDYAAVTASFRSDIALLYVLDIPNHQLNIYVPNLQTSSIDIKANIDLTRAFR